MKDPASGDVITELRNFYGKKGKKGAADDVFFSRPTYLCKGDPYRNRSAVAGRTLEKDGFKKAGHDIDFKPARVVHEKVPKHYPYIPLGPKAKKVYRNAEGEVITEGRNFYTTRLKQGKSGPGTTFSGKIPYVADDYNI